MRLLRNSRDWIRDRVLLVLDDGPSHGYEILSILNEYAPDLRLTTLYRWLHEMEEEGLISSEFQAGPHGPDRRVYSLGARGENRLREVLKDSIDIVMHFYDAYRRASIGNLFDMIDETFETPSGRVLFTAFPRIRESDIPTIEYLRRYNERGQVDVLGDSAAVEKIDRKHRRMNGHITDIPSPNERFSQVWISGVPTRHVLHSSIIESNRVLKSGGVLRVLAPFVYFEGAEEPDLGTFVKTTAIQLFPELGMSDADDIGEVIESVMPECSAMDVFPGLVVFLAKKA
jgi:DNA-binding PadR family transcriptional regulator